MAVSPSEMVVIEEIETANPKRLELTETDLPFGMARDMAAFESGGTVEIPDDGIYLPGSSRIIYQVINTKERPFVIKGAFRDSQAASTGHARAMRDQLEAIRRRARLLQISWDGQERVGILKETRFGEEDAGNITYEATFLISLAPQRVTIENADANKQIPIDATVDMQERAIEMRARALLQSLPAQIRLDTQAVFEDVTLALNDLSSMVSNYADAVTSAPQNLANAISGVSSAVHTGMKAVAAAFEALQGLTVDSLTHRTAKTVSSFWTWQFDTSADLNNMRDVLRDMLATVNRRRRAGQRLYEVKEDDTLEDIAMSELGSRGRAGDLGLRQDELVPGRLIRIPGN